MSSTTADQVSAPQSATKTARLYRMVMPGHTCPHGLKSKWYLERNGYTVEDHHLTTREEIDAFKEKHGVKTTPQAFIEGERIGGFEALKHHFDSSLAAKQGKKSYAPVLVIFGVCALMAWGASFAATGQLLSLRGIEWFAAFSMAVLAIQKLRDVESFSTMFLNYDLLAKRWVPYGYIYPFAEGLAAVLMIAGGSLALAGSPIALVIGTIGAFSVFKAVYVERRDLKCACVGGNSNVPLGFLSLTENLVMITMGLWVPFKILVLG
ncbi:glutaredoxin [Parvularcula sp. ZS-1/3]|uniref:Methylamine utilization protein MauE n=1 Tax=Parvularcula mediterranea TaxID=2732508 RepID=A0A7Y3RMY8_9PROT|nr:MauE/DoxX family redox-associated membrane protein [Parvularcula mediterranea]NNU17039.1 glutaredoxin [Parvularcula mediterranea]